MKAFYKFGTLLLIFLMCVAAYVRPNDDATFQSISGTTITASSTLDVTGAVTNSSTLSQAGNVTFGVVMGLNKQTVAVDLTTPAAAFNVGTDIPANSVIVAAAMRADTLITGASSADRFGLGDASCSDPDKYLETTALIQNSKDADAEAWTVLSSAEDLQICAMTDASTAGGTVGGASEAVTVEVWYFQVSDLPNA